MSQTPIHKALSIFRKHRVRALLMGGQACILLGLVQAKKTQRDKDWPMIRRLLEADYYRRPPRPTRERIVFWLREVRTSEILVALCRRYAATARRLAVVRPALRQALRGDRSGVARALQAEQEMARASDREYWEPLRTELARWRRSRRSASEVES